MYTMHGLIYNIYPLTITQASFFHSASLLLQPGYEAHSSQPTLEEKMALGLGALSKRVTFNWIGMSEQEGILYEDGPVE